MEVTHSCIVSSGDCSIGAMERTPISTVIERLAERHDLINPKTGKVNYTAFGLFAQIPPPTIMRWHKSPPEWDMAAKQAAQLAKAFDITEAQARGYAPLGKKYGDAMRRVTKEESELLDQLRALSPRERQALLNSLKD